MRRRDVITLLGGTAAAWPLAARGQRQPEMPVLGFFSAGSSTTKPWPQHAAAFRQGLQETGFIDGQNVVIEYRWAENQYDRLPVLAADLIQRRVAVIVATQRASIAVKALTSTIPIVFLNGGDPVRQGLVERINRPGGNVTGVTVGGLNEKRFGLLRDLVLQAGVIGVLSDSTNPNAELGLQEVQMAARSIGMQIRVLSAGTEREIEAAFATFASEGVTAVHINAGFFFNNMSYRLAAVAAHHRIVASGESRIFVEAGGLMSYGADEFSAMRLVGRYAGRILKGEKPGDLPVMLPTRFEFVINLKTVKELGITVPPGILAIADEVIE